MWRGGGSLRRLASCGSLMARSRTASGRWTHRRAARPLVNLTSDRSPFGLALAFARGCRTNPRRPHWSRCTGGVENAESIRSSAARSTRPGRSHRLAEPFQRRSPSFSRTGLCDSLAQTRAPASRWVACPLRTTDVDGFLRWGQTAFGDLKVVPPGTGIVHQVNLEYLARVVESRDGVAFPDTRARSVPSRRPAATSSSTASSETRSTPTAHGAATTR
jgi:hypothetical protein